MPVNAEPQRPGDDGHEPVMHDRRVAVIGLLSGRCWAVRGQPKATNVDNRRQLSRRSQRWPLRRPQVSEAPRHFFGY